MTIGVYTFELHLPDARSLKQRRQVVRRLKDRLRSRHNVAVAESNEHADLWQRAALVVVSVASGRDALDRLFESVFREAESQVPGQVIETGRDFIDGADGGPAGWGRGLGMTTHRPERIADLLHQILAGVVRDKLRDPRVGFVTLTEVRVSPDLRHARVFVSKLGNADEREATVDALNHASAYLRREVAHKAQLRYVPALEFFADGAIETGMRVENLLRDIHHEDESHEGENDEGNHD